ncbi:hypothetical protein H9X85_07235 [Anaerotignum lactatifermentans]|uniref:Uncharacterized protein n=1 Tax=Anaerotignum lactatifermentans TaxID=160404 RepID=A0ABS2GAZ2_9FIRM|nr:hypothetical protein [Anaerotignum lactatifermentans]MBM6829424.1 hypothetical protein [Anaerotignum lactatifermentans]MBM6877782.1 hypothetical protein [Anaerotignum lactatifermentans]MBM6951001.1 hypothetical protein [Anaerotignum lactatifermentans]
MKKIRNWMYVGLVLLIVNLHIGGINVLPRALGYAVLTWCVWTMQKEETGRHWQTLLGELLTAYSLVFEYSGIRATIPFWTISVGYQVLDLLFFYGIATLLYQKRQEEFILLRRRNLLMICAVNIMAFCLQLNLPAIGLVRGITDVIYLLYLFLAIVPLCRETPPLAECPQEEEVL